MLRLSISAASLLKDANIVPGCVITLHLYSGESCIAIPRTFTGEGMRATFPDGQAIFVFWGAIESFAIKGAANVPV